MYFPVLQDMFFLMENGNTMTRIPEEDGLPEEKLFFSKINLSGQCLIRERFRMDWMIRR